MSRGCASPGGGPQIAADFTKAYPTSRLSNNFRSTPLMINGVLFATNAVGIAEAFDPETGRTLWSQKIAGDLGGNPGLGGALRAVAAVERPWRAPHLHLPQAVSLRAQPGNRRGLRQLRQRRARRPQRQRRVPLERPAPRRPRRRHRRVVQPRSGFRRQDGRGRRRSAGVRRADRKAAVDLPRDSARRRARRSKPSRTIRGSTSARGTSGRR